MRELKVGDPVLLTLNSPGSVGITPGLLKYQDRRFRISKVKTLLGIGAVRGTYYELKGCESDKGIPYAITADWFQPIRELEQPCTEGRRRR